MGIISFFKQTFKNTGDVYFSEKEMNIGFQLDDFVKVIELCDTDKAKNIQDYIDVGQEIYGKDFIHLIKEGEINQQIFWTEVKNRITKELQKELDIDNLDSRTLDEIKIFYQKLDKGETTQAIDIPKQILTRIGVNDNSLSLYHYLEYEIYKSDNQNKKAFDSLEKAINLCYSNLYLSTILYFTQSIIKRSDLALKLFQKHYNSVNKHELTEDLLLNITNFFLLHKQYDIVIEICENIIAHSNFRENDIWKYYFISNLISAKISSFQITSTKEETFVTSNLKTIYNGINSIYGKNSSSLAKAYYSNYSMYYKKKFDINMEVLKKGTIHKMTKSLIKDNGFIEYNFDLPKKNIINAKEYIKKAIEIKKKNNDLTDLGQTISNLLTIHLDEIKLKKIFKWKIKYLCEKYDLKYSSEVSPFNKYIEIETNLDKIEKLIYTLPELYPTESYQLSMDLTIISDALKSILEKKTGLINWCYKKALDALPYELKKDNDLYLYLNKEIQNKEA